MNLLIQIWFPSHGLNYFSGGLKGDEIAVYRAHYKSGILLFLVILLVMKVIRVERASFPLLQAKIFLECAEFSYLVLWWRWHRWLGFGIFG